jgi:RHS repeat-associated protein
MTNPATRLTATDANGHQTFFYHDELGRQTNVVMYGAGASVPLSSTFTEYDAMGRRSAEVDAVGVRKLYGYDTLGRLSSVTQYLNRQALVTKYTYDSLGRMLTQTDAENHTTTFEYDVLGRRTARILPGNQRETYTYDAVGNMLTHTDFNGHTTTYEYDSFGRLVAEVADPAHPSLALAHAPARVEYVYDVRGNRVTERLLNASGVELHADRYAFDSTGQMAWHHSSYEDNSFAHRFDYGRDAAGNLTNILSSTAGGASTVLTYDELNRLSKVYVQDGGVIEPANASYTYDNVGSLSAVNYANGIEHAYTYNALNRLTNLTHWVTDPVSSLKSQVSSLSYTLDARGYRTQIVEASGRESHYTNDTLGRLTREYLMGDPTVANGASDYTYDKVGNRLSRTSSGFMPANQDFTYNENDWLDSDTYDSNGNTILSDVTQQGPNVASNVADVYDFRNRLIRRTYDSGLILDYSYNARGTRIGKAKRIGGALVNRKLFVVDDQNLTGYVQTLEEWTAAGFDAVSLNKVYDYGLDLVSQTRFEWDAQTSSLKPHTSYLIYDGHGSVRALADDSGTITDSYTYDAFGIQLSQQVLNTTTGEMEQLSIGNLHSAIDNAYKYCGEYYDADLGLYYLRARHMNPETGRFHTMDTYEGRLGESLSLHKYMYAHANPVMGIDPSGMMTYMDVMGAAQMYATLAAITYGTVSLTWLFVANPIEIALPRYEVEDVARRIRQQGCSGIIGETQERVLYAKYTRYRLSEVLPNLEGVDPALWETMNMLWISSLMTRKCLIIDIGYDPDRSFMGYSYRGFFYAREQFWTAGYPHKYHDNTIPGSANLSLSFGGE